MQSGNKSVGPVLRFVLPLAFITGLVAVWQAAASGGMINTSLIPGPRALVLMVPEIPSLMSHVGSSLYRLFIAVAAGTVLGFLAALAVHARRKTEFIEDVVSFFMSIPGISWAPLFIILMGFGDRVILSVGVLTSFFPVMYQSLYGFREIDTDLIKLGKLLEYSPSETTWRILVPGIMRFLVVGIKLAFARTWRTIIAVEMIAATMYGLGYLIFDARELLNVEVMFSGILLSGIAYLVIEFLVGVTLERTTVKRWGMVS
ncbi:MAG: ABC transporter permease subunit [Spirochaetales bacterium]|nr:ABC transporter permease subunit [Spirochaetales bacterium]MCF7937751.1 ABC transporter permease subunit [Spirochaetales bacterium]